MAVTVTFEAALGNLGMKMVESCALDRWKRYVSMPTHKDTQCWPKLSILCGLPEDHFLVLDTVL